MISSLIMTIDDKIRDENLQYNINRIAAKMSALSSGRVEKNAYPTGEEVVCSDQSRMIDQARFTCYPLGISL